MRRKNRKSGWSLAIVGKSRNAERWWGVVGKNVQKRERERERMLIESVGGREISREERDEAIEMKKKERKKERMDGRKKKRREGEIHGRGNPNHVRGPRA